MVGSCLRFAFSPRCISSLSTSCWALTHKYEVLDLKEMQENGGDGGYDCAFMVTTLTVK